ncbi:MAG: hypothetical protein R6U98_06870 [Pirellulaceae bacterium]
MDPLQVRDQHVRHSPPRRSKKKRSRLLSNPHTCALIAVAGVLLVLTFFALRHPAVVTTAVLGDTAADSPARRPGPSHEPVNEPRATGPLSDSDVQDDAPPQTEETSQEAHVGSSPREKSEAPTETSPPDKKEVRGGRGENPPALAEDAGSNPFSLLPEEITLQFPNSGEKECKTDIGALQADADAAWKVEIHSEAASLEGLCFDVGAAQVSKDVIRWPVCLSILQSKDDEKKSKVTTDAFRESVPVAHIVASKRQLCLTLNLSGGGKRLPQLQNSVVTLSDGNSKHKIQLRECKDVPLVGIELKKPTISCDFAFDAMPKLESLVLRLPGGMELPPNFTVTPINKMVHCNENLSLKSTKLASVSVQTRFNRTEHQIKVRVMPRYEFAGREHPLVLSEIQKDIVQLDRQVSEMKNDLAAAKNELQAVSKTLGNLQSRVPRTRREAFKIAARIAELKPIAKKLQARIKRLGKRIPQSERKVRQLRYVFDFAKDFAGTLDMQYELIASTSAGEVRFLKTN